MWAGLNLRCASRTTMDGPYSFYLEMWPFSHSDFLCRGVYQRCGHTHKGDVLCRDKDDDAIMWKLYTMMRLRVISLSNERINPCINYEEITLEMQPYSQGRRFVQGRLLDQRCGHTHNYYYYLSCLTTVVAQILLCNSEFLQLGQPSFNVCAILTWATSCAGASIRDVTNTCVVNMA